MKVVICWSGDNSRSQKVAEALYSWLETEIDYIDPWLSVKDIEKGKDWFQELARQLEEAHAGIICLTPESLEAPWIMFEAGALSMQLKDTYVCPYLFGFSNKDFFNKCPLARLQATEANQSDTYKLISTIIKAVNDTIPKNKIERLFNDSWPKLNALLKQIPDKPPPSEQRTTMRGISMNQAIENTGLVDIENRDNFNFELPPKPFYEIAKNEIFIIGLSLYMTFHKYADLIEETIARNIKMYVVLMHPKSEDLMKLTEKERRSIKNDIIATIDTIKLRRLHDYPEFRVKFIQKLPAFTGIMIDGDVSPASSSINDEFGQVRIQPHAPHVSVHKGVIFQLKKIIKSENKPAGPFDYFAHEFRETWKADAAFDKDLFTD